MRERATEGGPTGRPPRGAGCVRSGPLEHGLDGLRDAVGAVGEGRLDDAQRLLGERLGPLDQLGGLLLQLLRLGDLASARSFLAFFSRALACALSLAGFLIAALTAAMPLAVVFMVRTPVVFGAMVAGADWRDRSPHQCGGPRRDVATRCREEADAALTEQETGPGGRLHETGMVRVFRSFDSFGGLPGTSETPVVPSYGSALSDLHFAGSMFSNRRLSRKTALSRIASPWSKIVRYSECADPTATGRGRSGGPSRRRTSSRAPRRRSSHSGRWRPRRSCHPCRRRSSRER